MGRKIVDLVLAAGMAFTTPACLPAPASLTVFGISLGEPVILPVCKWGSTHPDKGACIGDDYPGAVKSKLFHTGYVLFAFYELPSWVEASRVRIYVVDGKVERLEITTTGLSGQADALKDLREKFGGPSKLQRLPMQNGLGAKFDAVQASWLIRDATVDFTSIISGTSIGDVTIESPKGRAAYGAYLETRPKIRKL